MHDPFEVPTEIAVGRDTGEVTVTFGPMPQAHVVEWLRFLRNSESFTEMMLDRIAETGVKHLHEPATSDDPIKDAEHRVLWMLEHAKRLASEYGDGFELELLFEMAKFWRGRRTSDA